MALKRKKKKEQKKAEAQIKVLDAEVDLEALQEKANQADEYLEHLQRLQAEFANYRKRVEKEKTDLRTFVMAEVIGETIEVVDNLERALESAEENQSYEVMHEGVEMVLGQFHNILKKKGLAEIEAEGATFDPNLHEAMATEPRDDVEAGTIIEVWQKGYQLGDKLLRPSKVKVAAAMPSSDKEENK